MVKELNKFMLSAISIISLTAIVLIGIAISTAFSKELRTTTTINASLDAELATLLINTSVAVGTSGTYPFLQELTGCVNSTVDLNELSTTLYTIGEGNTGGGTIFLNQDGFVAGWNGTEINCSNLNYLANSGGQAVADKFSDGLGIFGTFAVIIILAIVGKAIISLFRKKD